MKKILVGLLGLVLLFVVVIAGLVIFIPTDFAVEREVVIKKPKAEVFQYIKMLKNQNDWAPWAKKDPNIKQTYTGEDGTIGFVAAWESKHEEVGSGEQEIKAIDDGKKIDYELRFKEPWESKSDAYIKTETVSDTETKVRWGFTGTMPRPMNLMLLFIDMEDAVGKDFEAGLGDLKKRLESKTETE